MADTLVIEDNAPEMSPLELAAMEYRRVCETISRREYEERMAQLTTRELAALPISTKVYRSLGKAFLISNVTQVKERLGNVIDSAHNDKTKLKQRKEQLEGIIRQQVPST